MFSPPGGASDLTQANRAEWSDFLSRQFFSRSKAGRPDRNDGPREQFFNPVEDDVPGPLATEVVTWTAFPRQIAINSASDAQRWRRADADRDVQDEYCEWAITEDENGDIARIDFTSEGPEYWQVLAILQPDTVVDLYRQLIGDHVEKDVIMPLGRYNPRNKYNNSTRNGLVHLIQTNNTLGAEIELAAGASIVRGRAGNLVTDTQDLIQCSRYGQAERHSDPHIGSRVNAHARDGRLVSLADPIGLFIAGCDFSDFEMPTANVQPEDCWHIERGSQDRPLRVKFDAPDGESFNVSDIAVGGRFVRRAGQIVDKITIGLAAWASASMDHLKIVDGCRGSSPGAGMAPAAGLSQIERTFEVRR
jgi:hypothetical protein